MAEPSIAVVVPALNEEANLEAAVRDVLRAIDERSVRGRVLVFNDGSTDGTRAVADRLAAADSRVVAIHNPATMGLGFNYFSGVERATEDYVLMVPGDNEIPYAAVRELLACLGRADLVIPFMTGSEARPWGRRVLSRAFVALLNGLFGLGIRYYNGPCVLRRELVLKTPIRTHGFAYMAAILVWLLRHGHSYVEPAIPLQYRRTGSSKALRPKNIVSVLGTLADLFWRLRLRPSQ